eukprot:31274-Pelagococcus_subviridis.AAC.8
MRGVAEVVQHHERRGEERVLRRPRVALRREHLARERVLMHAERQRRPARGLAHLDVLARLRRGQHEEVRDAEHAGHLHEVLQLVSFALLQVRRGVRLHHVAEVVLQILDVVGVELKGVRWS